MKYAPVAIKIILNGLFLCIYVLIWILLVNFMYGFIVSQLLWWVVAGPENPIHMKLAVISSLCVIIFSVIGRRYFYLSLGNIGKTDDNMNDEV